MNTAMNTAPVTSLIDEQLAEIETRFQVQSKGRMWHIVDRVEGKTCLLYTSPSPRD